MSLRGFIALLLSSTFVLSIGFIALTIAFLRDQIAPLFPPDLVEANSALQVLLVENAVASLCFAILLLAVLFAILGRYIVKPLKTIVQAMSAFATTGVHQDLPPLTGVPKEIRELAAAFTGFRDRVELSHEHDAEVSRMKSDFISTAAHQLRTPLTGVRWSLEALQKDALTDEQQVLVTSALEKSHELVSIVGTLLDISSIESGKFKYDFKPMDFSALVERTVRDFEPMAEQRQVALVYEKSGETIPQVRGDAEHLKWILNNLIENAIRYTPASGSVRVTMDSDAGRVYTRVHDTGIGIPTKDRENIFERFYRSSNAVAKENSGNGLGLYIARTIASDHGGDIHFEANEGSVGTTFILALPQAG